MNEVNNSVKEVRKQRRIMMIWLTLGVLFYGVILGQSLNSIGEPVKVSWLQDYSTLIISIMFGWGLFGFVMQISFAIRKPK